MAALTKKKLVQGIISAYGLEAGAMELDGTCSEITDSADSQGNSNKEFVRAMVVMKKVREDGLPGVIVARGGGTLAPANSVSVHNSDGGSDSQDFLCIGSVGAAYNRPALEALGVTHVLCLADICKIKFPEHFVYKKVSCRDTLDQDIFAVLEECFSFINAFRELREATGGQGRILIHCYQGVSRAATICAAYLIKFFGHSVDEALVCIRHCRPQASPNYNFMKSLRILEAQNTCK